jgi:hypothetical protein
LDGYDCDAGEFKKLNSVGLIQVEAFHVDGELL